jgi:phage tail sheath protein FI
MPEYLSPGVYVEEISTGPRPIEGVSTSTTGFVGMTERGPEYPRLVTSWLEYQRWFGSYLSPDVSYLAYAVQGFFDNGGKRLFIGRVVPGAASSGAVTPPTRAQIILKDLTVWTNGRGAWGNNVFIAVEQATKAMALKPGDPSPVAKWLKLTLLYYTKQPPGKTFKIFDDAQHANDLAIQSATSGAALDKAGAGASTAVAAFETTPNDANKAKAVQAVSDLKTAAAAFQDLAVQFLTAATATQDQAAAAVNIFPTDANLKAASDSAAAAAKAAGTAKTSADTAVNDANAAAAQNPPTSAKTDTAKGSAAQANTDMIAAVTAAKAAADKAAAAYPLQQIESLAAQAAAALDAALTAANAAKAPLTDFENDNTNAAKKAVAKTAVGNVKTATDAAKTIVDNLKTAADNAKTAADAGSVQAVKDAAKAAQDAAAQLQTDTTTVVTASDASAAAATPTTALNDAVVAALPTAKASAVKVVTAAHGLVVADAATQSIIPVNPLIPENQRDPNFRAPDYLEVYDNLRPLSGATNSLELAVNSSSQLVVVKVAGADIPLSALEPVPGSSTKKQVVFTALSGGATGVKAGKPLDAPTLEDFIGSEAPVDLTNSDFGTGTGLAGLGMLEGISLLAAPDEASIDGLSEEVIKQCELLRDRFGIVSAPFGKSNVSDVRPTQDTTYAAFYYPWISVYDPLSNGPIFVPATGHIAGLIARVDVDRGVHKAPANEVLRDAIDLEYPIPKGKQDLLNPIGVNCFRDFRPQGRSIRLWGARTMTSDPEWKYINVRRLFIFIEQSILRGTQWVVFEPNNDALWASVILSITNFLVGVWKSGALLGRTQEEAFFVRCDRTTMTQDDIDNGRLVCLIGIAPTKPAEFVIFRISQKVAEAPQ